jgi:hypothetical protein
VDFREVGCGGMDWIEPGKDTDSFWALLSAVINHRVS